MDMYAMREFCRRWIEKASYYGDDELEDLFDKFFTLFVVYNRYYSIGGEIIRSKMQASAHFLLRGDRNEATTAMEKFIGQQRFSNHIESRPVIGDSCATIAGLLQRRHFFLHTKRDSAQPDWDRDAKLIDGLAKNRLKAVLDCLYQIRCNIFHGEKEFTPRQAELLLPAIELLAAVIRLSEDALQEHNAI